MESVESSDVQAQDLYLNANGMVTDADGVEFEQSKQKTLLFQLREYSATRR